MPRLTLEFPEQVNKILKELAKKDQTTKVEVIRRSLALYEYLHKEVTDNNKRVVIADDNGIVQGEIVF